MALAVSVVVGCELAKRLGIRIRGGCAPVLVLIVVGGFLKEVDHVISLIGLSWTLFEHVR